MEPREGLSGAWANDRAAREIRFLPGAPGPMTCLTSPRQRRSSVCRLTFSQTPVTGTPGEAHGEGSGSGADGGLDGAGQSSPARSPGVLKWLNDPSQNNVPVIHRRRCGCNVCLVTKESSL